MTELSRRKISASTSKFILDFRASITWAAHDFQCKLLLLRSLPPLLALPFEDLLRSSVCSSQRHGSSSACTSVRPVQYPASTGENLCFLEQQPSSSLSSHTTSSTEELEKTVLDITGMSRHQATSPANLDARQTTTTATVDPRPPARPSPRRILLCTHRKCKQPNGRVDGLLDS